MKTQKFLKLSVMMLLILMTTLLVPAGARARPLLAGGDFLWAKSMGGSSYDIGEGIALDSKGNVCTTGSYSGTVDFDPGVGTFNLTSSTRATFISKLDSNGNFVWAKGLGETGSGSSEGWGIAIDSSDNVFTIGEFSGTVDFDPGAAIFNLTSAGYSDVFVSRLGSDGDFVWAKSLGGSDYDSSNGIVLDVSGNIYAVGSFRGTADFDPGVGAFNLTSAGAEDVFVSKLDSDGNFVWAKSMGGLSGDYGYHIALMPDGSVYTVGGFNGTADFDPGAGTFNLTSAGFGDIFISKLNSNGDFVWAKSIGGSDRDVGSRIALDASSNIFTTGFFKGTADFDPGAGTFSLASAGSYDMFVAKLDSDGNFVWAKSMGGANDSYGSWIVLDPNNSIYTTGDFTGTVDFDPGLGASSLTSAGLADTFVAKLDSDGNFVWAKSMGGSDYDFGYSIALDSSGNIYTTGGFSGIADFDSGPDIYNLTSVGLADIFISKLAGETAIKPITIDIKPGSYPNPINLRSKGAVPVAVLTTADFDASTLNPGIVIFAGASPLSWTQNDVDWDGDMDLLFHFKTRSLKLDKSSTEASLTGMTFEGVPVEGSDSVKIVPRE